MSNEKWLVIGNEIADHIVKILGHHKVNGVAVTPERASQEFEKIQETYAGVILTNNGMYWNDISTFLKKWHYSNIRTIVTSGHITEQIMSEWNSLGVGAILSLPFPVEDLMNVIAD